MGHLICDHIKRLITSTSYYIKRLSCIEILQLLTFQIETVPNDSIVEEIEEEYQTDFESEDGSSSSTTVVPTEISLQSS